MVAHAARRDMITLREVICSRLSWRQTVLTGVFSVVPWYDQIWLTRSAHCLTGHKTGPSVRLWMIVLYSLHFSAFRMSLLLPLFFDQNDVIYPTFEFYEPLMYFLNITGTSHKHLTTCSLFTLKSFFLWSSLANFHVSAWCKSSIISINLLV